MGPLGRHKAPLRPAHAPLGAIALCLQAGGEGLALGDTGTPWAATGQLVLWSQRPPQTTAQLSRD